MIHDIKGKELRRDRNGHGPGNDMWHELEFDAPVWSDEVEQWLEENGWLGYHPHGYGIRLHHTGQPPHEPWPTSPSRFWTYRHSASCD